ncbi:hypothetical protein [Ferribacterium limneticum]|uniref:hypothetical protein n=1 Tax=Ferribacterium limneticum TaxID=76259 RepID=UPI001CF925F5|nr:hypothetical protein [Ferribacterium limneticum]UCV26789.1 hypothetical protein KI617_10750 [Ferribacterium limneticum]UCV30706.1 hypothetical protein KI608_10750 [Ferribacterium limneticum]
MKAFDLAAGITIVLILSLQAASFWALSTHELSFKDYAALWAPALTLALGYWFRGTQAVTQ